MILAIVPAYNEAKRITKVVGDLLSHVSEVVVIDDASADRTTQLAKSAGATVITHSINRGQGAALETGHAYARQVGADYVVHFDGDGQFNVEDIAPALQALKEAKADVLFGSRISDNRSNTPFFKKHILIPSIRLFHKILYKLEIADVHNGFRILSAKALDKISITQDGMAHATEIPVQVHQKKLTYITFPVQVTYHEYGQKLSGASQIVHDLVVGKLLHK